MRYFSIAFLLILFLLVTGQGLHSETPDRSGASIKAIPVDRVNITYSGSDDLVLRYFDPDSETPFVYLIENEGFQGEGWLHGHNSWTDYSYMTGFYGPGGDTYLNEVRIWWGYKSDGVTNQTYTLDIRQGQGGDIGNGPHSSADPIYSEEFDLADINADEDTGTIEPTVYTFDPPLEVPDLFFVGVFIAPYASSDRWAAIAASDYRGGFIQEDWFMMSDGQWYLFSEIYFNPAIDGWHMWIEAVVTGDPVSAPDNELPLTLELGQNYPNPFNPSTQIGFALPNDSHVLLTVYDILGREVARLVDREMAAGSHTVNFDASSFTSGVYFYRIQAGEEIKINRMTLLK